MKLYYDIEFLDILEPEKGMGWHANVKPADHPVSKFEFDFIVGKLVNLWNVCYCVLAYSACIKLADT